MKINKSIQKNIETYANIWNYMDKYGKICKCMDIYRKTLKIIGKRNIEVYF